MLRAPRFHPIRCSWRTTAVLAVAAASVWGWVVTSPASTGGEGAGAEAQVWDRSLGVRDLHAAGMLPQDTDRDGLPDRQELVLATDPLLADTDGDGWSDGEEFAMQSNPRDASVMPAGSAFSVGMSARGEAGKLFVFLAIHLPQGQLDKKTLRFGILSRGHISMFTYNELVELSLVDTHQTPGGGLLITHDVRVPLRFVNQGPATYFAALAKSGRTGYASADKIDLFTVQGVPMLRDEVGEGILGVVGGGSTTIHKPIPPKGEGGVPVDWQAGKVCFQTSSVAGVSGGVVTHQIETAECVEALQTYCESDCAATVGSSYQTIDIGVLIGG